MSKQIILIFLTISVLWAQNPNKANNKRSIDAMRIYRLVEVLDLTDSQVDTFIPALKKHDRAIKALREKKADMIREGRKLVDSENLSQKQVDKLLKSINKIDAEIQAERLKFIASLPKYLKPKQQLKYVGFEQRFRKEVGKFLQNRGDIDKRRPDFENNRKRR